MTEPVLLTGATGCVGSRLLEALLDSGRGIRFLRAVRKRFAAAA